MTEELVDPGNISDSVQLWWRERGGGLPIALILGGPGVASDYLHPLFEQLVARARVIQFDPRGCGRSEAPPPYDLATNLDALDALRTMIGIKRWVLIGHSAGASFALAHALEFPERTTAIVAIAGGGGVHDDRGWHAASAHVPLTQGASNGEAVRL